MREPKVSDLKKYLSCLVKMNKKYVTAERLSKVVGIYPEIIVENLTYFEPTLPLDPDFNLLELVPEIKNFISEKEEQKLLSSSKKVSLKKKDYELYDSIGEFVYLKMTNSGGLIDRNATLSEKDLKVLKKLINEELASRNKK